MYFQIQIGKLTCWVEVIEPIQFGWVAHVEKEIDEQMMIYNDSIDQNLIRKYTTNIWIHYVVCCS